MPPPVDRLGQFAGTTWNFVYTIVSTWTDTYYLGHTYQFTSSGVRMLDGTDEYGDGIGMSLTASYDIPYEFILVDPGTELCEAFVFDITSPTTVAGQVFFFYPDCETLMGSPESFVGYMQ